MDFRSIHPRIGSSTSAEETPVDRFRNLLDLDGTTVIGQTGNQFLLLAQIGGVYSIEKAYHCCEARRSRCLSDT